MNKNLCWIISHKSWTRQSLVNTNDFVRWTLQTNGFRRECVQELRLECQTKHHWDCLTAQEAGRTLCHAGSATWLWAHGLTVSVLRELLQNNWHLILVDLLVGLATSQGVGCEPQQRITQREEVTSVCGSLFQRNRKELTGCAAALNMASPV